MLASAPTKKALESIRILKKRVELHTHKSYFTIERIHWQVGPEPLSVVFVLTEVPLTDGVRRQIVGASDNPHK